MRTLIDKINYFEAGTETVKSFNSIFDSCELLCFSSDAIVTIGEPCSPETCRELSVDGITFRHDFKPNIQSIKELEEDYKGNTKGNTGEWSARKAAGLPFWKNANGEYATLIKYNEGNTIMTQKEMSLRPVHYFLLQYLRGSESHNHTQIGMELDLNISVRTIRDNLKEMEQAGIITTENLNYKGMKILVNEDWA